MQCPFRISALLAVGWVALVSRAAADPEVHAAPTANPTFADMPRAVLLWPRGAPGSEGKDSPEQTRWENYATTWYSVVTNINAPSIVPYLPARGTATGAAVIVCPGGGHQFLALEHEGNAVGKWLSERGIAAFVLKYRLARAPGSTYRVDVHALMDAQRAIRTVRGRAKEWGVNPAAVGIMGFSAGGEVAYLAATQFDRPVVQKSDDPVDAFDCRPDFAALLYPGLPDRSTALAAHIPPTFLCGASDDPFHLTPPMVQLYLTLEAAGVPCELHVYAQGGHGFGIRDEDKAVYSWMPLFRTWVSGLGTPGKPGS
jgi:acetyl esterase/lipase